jgi:23S rRNA (adenine2030-N6)-methyltransferase
LPADVAALLAPYLLAIAAENRPGELTTYPGSPRLARSLLRPQDRLIVNELHPDDAAELKSLFARDRQTTVLELDGWVALKSLLPPKEKRGVLLIDPPFEQPGELDRLVRGLSEAVTRFATGIYMLWYPIKDPRTIDTFHQALAGLGFPKLLICELMLRAPRDVNRLNGTGLAILNPPWQLDGQLAKLLPFLVARLGENDASDRLFWLGMKAD